MSIVRILFLVMIGSAIVYVVLTTAELYGDAIVNYFKKKRK